MITNAFLSLFTGFLNILLAPVGVIEFGIDLVNMIPSQFYDFMKVIFYILPIQNIMPVITITVSILIFKATIALVKLIIEFVPFM